MAVHSVLLVSLALSMTLPVAFGHGSVAAIHKKLRRLDNDVIQLKSVLPEMEGKISNELALAEHYLEAKLINTIVPWYIEGIVQQSLNEVLAGRGLEDMVSGHLIRQLGSLRNNVHHMKRKYQVMYRRLEGMDLMREQTRKREVKEDQITRNIESIGQFTIYLEREMNATRETLTEIEMERERHNERLLNEHRKVTVDIAHIKQVTTSLREDLNTTRETLKEVKLARERQNERLFMEHRKVTKDIENIEQATTLLQENLNTTSLSLKHIETESEQLKESIFKEHKQVAKDIEIINITTSLLIQDLNNSKITQALMMKEKEEYQRKLNIMIDTHQHLNTSLISLRKEVNMTGEILGQITKDVINVGDRLNQTVRDVEKCDCHDRSTTSPTPITSTPTTSQKPTTEPLTVEKDMDLLVAPFNSTDHFERLHLNNISLSKFPLQLSKVFSVLYISSVRSLLICTRHPNDTLLSFNIDTKSLSTVRQNILLNGMAIDEGRQVVFVTVVLPRFSVSRMDVGEWRHREIVNTTKYGRLPLSIAVYPRQRMIYACVVNKLLSVDYDGHNVQTLFTGSHIRSVTLDQDGGILYFNSDENLFRMSLSSATTKVLHISHNPYTIIHYKGIVYTLNSFSNEISVVHLVSKSYNIVKNKLQIVKGIRFSMCLIPVVGN